MEYTGKDHATFLALWRRFGYAKNPPFQGEVSNTAIGEHLKIGTSGAAARLRRLEKLGVIDFEYSVTPETGRTVVREIVVKKIPDPPWGFYDEYF